MRTLSDYQLSRKDNAPKYEQVKRVLLDYITDLPPDIDYLPYEHEMETQLGISRRSIRRALEELRNNGIIETVRNRGSRIISRSGIPAAPIPAIELKGLRIAAVFSSDKNYSGPTDYPPWHIAAELEKLLNPAGVNVAVYNLRESSCPSMDAIVGEMLRQQVKWAFIYPSDRCIPTLLFQQMIESHIKPVIMLDDMVSLAKYAPTLCAGVDYIALNHEHKIYTTLHQHYADTDFLAYCGTDFDYSWANPRIAACARFAAEKVIDFEYAEEHMDDCNSQENAIFNRFRYDAGFAATEKILAKIRKAKHPLLLADNDRLAAGVIACLQQNNLEIPNHVRVIGYDNLLGFRHLNLTTFDFNAAAIATAMGEILQNHLRAPENSLKRNLGQIILPSFIKRITA